MMILFGSSIICSYSLEPIPTVVDTLGTLDALNALDFGGVLDRLLLREDIFSVLRIEYQCFATYVQCLSCCEAVLGPEQELKY